MGEDRVTSTHAELRVHDLTRALRRIPYDSGGADADGKVGFPVQAVCAPATHRGIRWAELFTAE